MQITFSVGKNGINRSVDVRAVQQLLKERGFPLRGGVDGRCGQYTIEAIMKFQAGTMGMKNADELVEPGKRTWQRLTNSNLCCLNPGAIPPAINIEGQSRENAAEYPKYGIRWPLASNKIRRGLINHTFGRVRNNNTVNHQGWDLFAVEDTPCFAVANGTVIVVVRVSRDRPDGMFGKLVTIKLDNIQIEGNPVYATYAHLSRFPSNISVGTRVTQGQVVGYTGNSGNAFDMNGDDRHLHFELRYMPSPGLGLGGRFDPKDVYGPPPLSVAHVDTTGVVNVSSVA
jgi:murein DD-endopeptidase MepM/ murein hydrolase activator NlpD